MNYTVKVFPLTKPAGKIVANASVVIDNVFEVKNFKICEGSNGLFAAPPSTAYQKDGETKYSQAVWFNEEAIDGEKAGPLQKEMLAAILEAYQDSVKSNGKTAAAKAQGTESRKPRRSAEW